MGGGDGINIDAMLQVSSYELLTIGRSDERKVLL